MGRDGLVVPLAGLVAVLMATAAGVGVEWEGVYRDNELVRSAWFGNDLVTLVVAVPLLIVALVLLRRDSRRGLLLVLGMLAYAGYNYAFYLFGAAYNDLFLVYVALLSASVLGLIAGLTSPRLGAVRARVRLRRADRIAGAVIALLAGGLGAFWIVVSLASVVTGGVPAMVTATGHPTNVTGALDLSLVVTFGVLGGVWLVAGRPWGYVISAVWAAKSAVYMAALSAATYVGFRRGTLESPSQMALWGPIGLVSVAVLVVLLRRRRA